jgi:hypothetical protein
VTAILGPVFGSASAYHRAVLADDRDVRAPLAVCRRLGFVQLGVRSGASTTAAGVLAVLARRRTGPVLGVDASPSPNGLLPRLGTPTLPLPPAAVPRERAQTAAEALAGLPRGHGGCYGLDLRPDRGGPVPADAWPAAAGPIARFCDVVGTDFGLRHPATVLDPVLATSHALCLVVRADDAAVAAAAARLDRWPGPPVVVALVAVDPGTRPARLARQLPGSVVPVAHEPGRPSRRHRTSCVRLAAALLRASARPEGGDRDR